MWDVIEWNFDSQAVGRQDILLRDNEGNEFRELSKNLDLMQYTGLKDTNEKEIYEGDLVKGAETDYKEVGGGYMVPTVVWIWNRLAISQ